MFRVQSVLYITIEYCQADLFSGNGICARSQVRRLAASSVHVHVICGRPKEANILEPSLAHVTVSPILLDTWTSTERSSSHEQFASGVARILDEVDWSRYDACLAVDWTGTNVFRHISEHSMQQRGQYGVPVVYLSLRSYVSMTGITHDDRRFYGDAERHAVRIAVETGGAVVSLCKRDDATLQSLAPPDKGVALQPGSRRNFVVNFPMLRAEIAHIALRDRDRILDAGRRRRYLTCLVRLSEDKGAHRFVQLLRDMERVDGGILRREGVVPLVLGAASQPAYAQKVREELTEAAAHAVVVDAFVTPGQLAALLQDALLNVHPALYEAYGMTVVEAAAMACPSVVHFQDIGATQLLGAARAGEGVVSVDWRDGEAVARTVCRLLLDQGERWRVARLAFERAVSWTEAEHGDRLLEVTQECVTECKRARG